MRLHGWSLQYQILGISSLVLSLLAGTVLYVKRRGDKTFHPAAVSKDDEAQSIEKKPRKSNRRESLAASEFSMGSPSYGSFTTYERIPAKHDNSDELASSVTSVKNYSMDEDNTDELVSPVTSVKNDSMAEDNIDELVSPVTRVKNDFAGSKPDKINTTKLRSMSIGNKVLPYYRSSSSTSSYNAGNTKRQSTGKLNSPDSGQDVIPHFLRAFTGSCHDFCKYGRKHSSEAKPWHPL
ncbi:hypothetical protein BC332_04642 [Capsicum chinense]|nr:hypothetical protein BC332_04642 [Capsicum chinense]